jgi:catechol 2,3-dioxygenase-like lactoylglutathione lyase family enzyme
MRITSAVLGSGDPRGLVAFYQRLLGWTIVANEGPRPGAPPEDGWAMLRAPEAAAGLQALSFQYETEYVPPVWPGRPGEQGMMIHLDVAVEDLDSAVAFAVAAGATIAEYQPQENVRVMLDPAGHPFCLYPGPV